MIGSLTAAYHKAQEAKERGESVPVEIPIMRDGEATIMTVNLATDDPWLVYGCFATGHAYIGNETVEVRSHLLLPREIYPNPPEHRGVLIPAGDDYFPVRLFVAQGGLNVCYQDGETGDWYEAGTIPWDAVRYAMQHAKVSL